MSKKRSRMYTVNEKNTREIMVIDMTTVQRKAAPFNPARFRTGSHMTEKDRPRKKNWSVDNY